MFTARLALKHRSILMFPPIVSRVAFGAARSAAQSFSSTPKPFISKMSSRTPPQKRMPAAYYRGGTSRAIMVSQGDLPADRDLWGPIFLSCIGSPDPLYGRQLDGMGGGISSLSKVCVVRPSPAERSADSDVDYTFVSLGVKDETVDFSSNCGNMSAAVGPFAVDSGMLRMPSLKVDEQGDELFTTVRIFNTNTNKIIHAKFPLAVASSPSSAAESVIYEAAASGSFAIDGVPDTAAPLELRFIDPAGSRTGKLFPTGETLNMFSIPPADGNGGNIEIAATCIDASNPCVFVSAESLFVPGNITPVEIDAHPTLKPRLEAIRRQAAIRMGLAANLEEVPGSVPKIGIVSLPPSDSPASSSARAVVVRAMSVGQPHKAVPVTVALALAAAANVPGTTVAACVSSPTRTEEQGDNSDQLVVNHASGTLAVAAKFNNPAREEKDGVEKTQSHLEYATVYRTARRLMTGEVFWKAT